MARSPNPSFDANELLRSPSTDFLPFLHQMLVQHHSTTELPELLSIVGRDRIREFLLAFEGATFTVPTWESVVLAVKDAYLLWKVEEMNVLNHHKTKKDLEEAFGVGWLALKARAEALKATLEKQS